MRRFGGTLLAATILAPIAGCGATSDCGLASCVVTRSPSAAATGAAITATAHGWTTAASIDSGSITVTVTVPGPLQVEGGCIPALVGWLVNPAGARVEASPSPAIRCQAIQVEDIPSGGSRTFTTTMPWPSPGAYTVHGLLRTHLPIGAGARVSENIPVVSLNVP